MIKILKRTDRKFTLIELLIIIAIIGIFMSILLPSLTKARAAGKSAVCMSNLRQIGVSHWSYMGDNNQYQTTLTTDWDKTWWTDELAAHMDVGIGDWNHTNDNAPVIFRCPDREGTFLGYGWNWKYGGTVEEYDGTNFGRVKYGWGRRWADEKDLVETSKMIGFGCNAKEGNFSRYRAHLTSEEGGFAGNDRHTKGGPNIAFLDTHVETRSAIELRQGNDNGSEWQPLLD